MMEQKQRIALVTGGVGAIGSAIGREPAANGCRVVGGYFDPVEREIAEEWVADIKAEGCDAEIASCDVTDCDNAKATTNDVQ